MRMRSMSNLWASGCMCKKSSGINSLSPAPIDYKGALGWMPAPAPIESTGPESHLQETGLTPHKYAYLKVNGCYSISISCAIEGYEDCTKNLPISVIFKVFWSLIWASESVWQWGKFWMRFFFGYKESNFFLDIKVLRFHSSKTSWMTSGEMVKLTEPDPSKSTTIFHQRPVRQAFLLFLFVFQLVVNE